MYLRKREDKILIVLLLFAIAGALILQTTNSLESITGKEIAEIQGVCGDVVSCNCGDTLTSSRTLTGSDSLEDCTGRYALAIGAPGITLNCGGQVISTEVQAAEIGIAVEDNFSNLIIENCILSNFSGAHIMFNATGSDPSRNVTVRSNSMLLIHGLSSPIRRWDGLMLKNVDQFSIVNNSFNATLVTVNEAGMSFANLTNSYIVNNTFFEMSTGIRADPSFTGLSAIYFMNNSFFNNNFRLSNNSYSLGSNALAVKNNTVDSGNVSSIGDNGFLYGGDRQARFGTLFINHSMDKTARITTQPNLIVAIQDNGSFFYKHNRSSTIAIAAYSNESLRISRTVDRWDDTNVSLQEIETFLNIPSSAFGAINYTIVSDRNEGLYTMQYNNATAIENVQANFTRGVNITFGVPARSPIWHYNVTFLFEPERLWCGYEIPCSCGDRITADKTLTENDTLTGCGSTAAVYINTSHVNLDCDGSFITGEGGADFGIFVENATNISIRNCNFYIFTGSGIHINGTGNNTIIEGNNFTALPTGTTAIFANDTSNITIKNNLFNSADREGNALFLSGIWESLIVDNVFYNMSTALTLNGTGLITRNNTVRSNTYNNNSVGLTFGENLYNNTIIDENVTGLQFAYLFSGMLDPSNKFVNISLSSQSDRQIRFLEQGGSFNLLQNLNSSYLLRIDTGINFVSMFRDIFHWNDGNITINDDLNVTGEVNYTITGLLAIVQNKTLTLYVDGVENQTTSFNDSGVAQVMVIAPGTNYTFATTFNVSIISPTGELSSSTTTDVSISTAVNSSCRYNTTGSQNYSDMILGLTPDSNGISHNATITGLLEATSYELFVQCRDAYDSFGSANVTYSVAESTPAPIPEGGGGGGGFAQEEEDEEEICREKTQFETIRSEILNLVEFQNKELFLLDAKFSVNKKLTNVSFTIDADKSKPSTIRDNPSGKPILFYHMQLININNEDVDEAELRFIVPLSFVPDNNPSKISFESYDPKMTKWKKGAVGCIIDEAIESSDFKSECLEGEEFDANEQFYTCQVPLREGFPENFAITLGAKIDVEYAEKSDVELTAPAPIFETTAAAPIVEEVIEVVTNPYVLLAILLLAIALITMLIIQEIILSRRKIQSMLRYYKQFKRLQNKYLIEKDPQKKSDLLYMVKGIRDELKSGWLESSTKVIYDNHTTSVTIIHDYKAKLLGRSGKKIQINVPAYPGRALTSLMQDQNTVTYLQALLGTKDDIPTISKTFEFISGKKPKDIQLWTPTQPARTKNNLRIAGFDFEKGKFRISASGIKIQQTQPPK